MQKCFKTHIETNFPFLINSPIALAVSGGIDSMVLLDLCVKSHLQCSVLHCNFQLRGLQSNQDQEFLKNQCEGYAVEFHTVNFHTKAYVKKAKISTQMGARELRYNWFREQKEQLGFAYLLTAHHADDNLETFLINLGRASGLEGLTGIPPINDYIVRPLLPFSRSEINRYAEEQNIAWREDSSNAQTKYIRNKYRHEIIPLIKQIKPDFLDSFTKSLQYLHQSNSIIKMAVAQQRAHLFVEKDHAIEISVAGLKALHPLEAYLFELFKPYGFKSEVELLQLLDTLSGKQLISDSHRLIRNRDHLLLTALKDSDADQIFTIPQHQKSIRYPIHLFIEQIEVKAPVSRNSVLVDKEKLKFPLILRKRRNGDYFCPFGMRGRKKLSKYFKDEKFSLIEKENQWLLCNGDDEIIWIIGQRADDRFKITDRTTEILKITSLHA
ncbi:tRNA lysidine(34) synthetase TilS [Galbibacter sp.]|uniref:tRNA lysidine(34) synthetase TilS n=1 Tax=Galbibacter sp. TaxID=2918471 RepID=UPI002C3FE35F|nr:tRNA lysidine(34) synthetase TilS [Galbibacter sp.]HLV64016.1 tRNA lysidine(34) synthetase TilS [Galbibacter sp.]